MVLIHLVLLLCWIQYVCTLIFQMHTSTATFIFQQHVPAWRADAAYVSGYARKRSAHCAACRHAIVHTHKRGAGTRNYQICQASRWIRARQNRSSWWTWDCDALTLLRSFWGAGRRALILRRALGAGRCSVPSSDYTCQLACLHFLVHGLPALSRAWAACTF